MCANCLCISQTSSFTEAYSEPCQISKMDFFVKTFAKAPSWMFDRVLNMPLPSAKINDPKILLHLLIFSYFFQQGKVNVTWVCTLENMKEEIIVERVFRVAN